MKADRGRGTETSLLEDAQDSTEGKKENFKLGGHSVQTEASMVKTTATAKPINKKTATP